jgi:ABC-2 type transport system ATP-binding protein
MTNPDFAVETAGLTKWFGNKQAVDSLTLAIPRGSIYAFLGRNGSGKTTTIRMLLGFLRPNGGTSSVLGHDSRALTPALRGRIGYMAERHPLHHWMTVAQEEYFASSFFGDWDRKLFDSIVTYFGLSRSAKVTDLSPGERAGLSLAITMAPRPELLILDEPAAGLDPVARLALLEKLIGSTAEAGSTVLFSSHQLEDVERVATHAAVLHYSHLRAQGSVRALVESVRRYEVAFAPGMVPSELPRMAGLLASRRSGNGMTLTFGGGARMPDLAGGHVVREMQLTLSEAVLAYLGAVAEKEESRGEASREPAVAGAGAGTSTGGF